MFSTIFFNKNKIKFDDLIIKLIKKIKFGNVGEKIANKDIDYYYYHYFFYYVIFVQLL